MHTTGASEAASLFGSSSSAPVRKASSASLAGHSRPDPQAAIRSPIAKNRLAEDANTSSSAYTIISPLASSSTPHLILDPFEQYTQQICANSTPNSAHPTHTPQGSSASTITLLSRNYVSHGAQSSKSNSTDNSLSVSVPDKTSPRDSCTNSPNETRQYITTMASPVLTSHSGPPIRKENSTTSARDMILLSNETRQTEFLDMDDEDDEEVGDLDEDIDSEQDEIPSSVDARFTDSPQPSQQLSASDTSSMISQGTQSDRGKGRTLSAVDDFPLPPSYIQPHHQQSTINQAGIVNQSHVPQSLRQQEVIQPAVSQPISSCQQHQPPTQPPHKDQSNQPTSPHMTTHFRALPLLFSDLPATTINVSHSFVRPNDRGKEVLSFVVHVYPGNGKPGWRVEKMYSDVLNLDQRIKQSVGRGVGKKIATLPEGKLWKDHAPAKVDQRKASVS